MTDADLIALADRECEQLLRLAHSAPLNPYRKDADGHRWVAQDSYSWRDRGREWVKACAIRDNIRARASTDKGEA